MFKEKVMAKGDANEGPGLGSETDGGCSNDHRLHNKSNDEKRGEQFFQGGEVAVKEQERRASG